MTTLDLVVDPALDLSTALADERGLVRITSPDRTFDWQSARFREEHFADGQRFLISDTILNWTLRKKALITGVEVQLPRIGFSDGPLDHGNVLIRRGETASLRLVRVHLIGGDW